MHALALHCFTTTYCSKTLNCALTLVSLHLFCHANSAICLDIYSMAKRASTHSVDSMPASMDWSIYNCPQICIVPTQHAHHTHATVLACTTNGLIFSTFFMQNQKLALGSPSLSLELECSLLQAQPASCSSHC